MAIVAELDRERIISRFRERIALGKRTKLFKAELEALIDQFILRLVDAQAQEEIQRLCELEIKLLEEGYPQSTLSSDYIPKYRRAIETAIAAHILPLSEANSHRFIHQRRVTGGRDIRAEHWALSFFKYDREVYEQLDIRQAQVNRHKLLNLKGVNPPLYLERLEELLNSTDAFQARHWAIAIAGFTGRRIGEVLQRGCFKLTDHPHLLHFEGQQKHEREGYDIVTLIPARRLLDKIKAFRSLPEIKTLMGLKGEALAQEVNKFDVQINRECHKFLALREAIVPTLEDRKRVTVHNLRSLWGAIAVWMFCPTHQHEYAFIQHYLGHVMESPATGHYFRYQLVDEEGRLRREKGTRLGEVPMLPIRAMEEVAVMDSERLLDFAELEQKRGAMDETEGEERTGGMMERGLGEALRGELLGLVENLRDSLRSEWGELLSALRTELMEQFAGCSQTGRGLETQGLVERVQELEQENRALVNDCEVLRAKVERGRKLEGENQALAAQLQGALAKLEQFRLLLVGDENTNLEMKIGSENQGMLPGGETLRKQTPRKRGRKAGAASDRAQAIFDALIRWNQIHTEQTLALNPGLLETGFRIHRMAAKGFCEQFADQIDEHHRQIGVQNLHSHNRGKDIEGFKQFVAELRD